MRPQVITAVLLATGSACAQINSTYVADLLALLKDSGLTTLASEIQNVANTTGGTRILTELSSNTSKFTIFAPNNDAFIGLPGFSPPSFLGDYISYHFGRGSLDNSSFAINPNHTIVTTLLNQTDYTSPGNSAVLVTTTVQSGSGIEIKILNQSKKVTVQSSTSFQNLVIHTINKTLELPVGLEGLFIGANLTAFNRAMGELEKPIFEYSPTLTIFAPDDAAFAKTLAALGNQATNYTLLESILSNHIINGTAAYSSQFTNGTYTSTGGQKFTFNSGSNGTTITSGNATANIVRADIPIKNGVVHIIDAVLANAQIDARAASSAYAAATLSAANAPTASGPVGSTKPNAGTSLAGSSGAFAGVAGAIVAAFLGGAFLI